MADNSTAGEAGVSLGAAGTTDSARFAAMPKPSFANLEASADASASDANNPNILSITSQAALRSSGSATAGGAAAAPQHRASGVGAAAFGESTNAKIITMEVPEHHNADASILFGGSHNPNRNTNLQKNRRQSDEAGGNDSTIEMKDLRAVAPLQSGVFTPQADGVGLSIPDAETPPKKGTLLPTSSRHAAPPAAGTNDADTAMALQKSVSASLAAFEEVTPETFEVTPTDQILRDQREAYAHRNLSLWEGADWRSRVYSIVEPYSFASDVPITVEWAAAAYSLATTAVVLVSCVSIMGSSYSDYVMSGFPAAWVVITSVCVAFFTIDTIIRFVTCSNRFLFFLDAIIWCDIIAVIPFYMSLFGSLELFFWARMLRVVRLVKLVKIFKGSSTTGLRSFVSALQHSIEGMFVFVAIAVTSMLILSTCTYFAERGTWNVAANAWYRKCLAYEHCSGPNNTEESPFQSISDAFWYTIVTMCTVGFGDQYPKTGLGQFVGGCTMLMGIFLMALPTMILSGHYDAGAEGQQRATHISWGYIYSQNVARLARPPVPMKEQLMRRKGWNYKDERQRLLERMAADSVTATAARRRSTLAGGDGGGGGGGPTMPQKRVSIFAGAGGGGGVGRGPMARRRSSVAATGLNGKDPLAIAEAFEDFASTIDSAVDEKPIAVFKIPNTHPERLGYLRRTKDPRRFLYDPIMALVLDDDGRPRATPVLGTDGMPSCVRFDILIDTPEAQAQAEAAAKHIHPGATAEVDNGGGWRVRHHSHLDTLKAVVIGARPSARYVMLPNVARAGFRDPRGSGVGVEMTANNISIAGDAGGGGGGATPRGGLHQQLNASASNLQSSSTINALAAATAASTLPIYFSRIPYNDTANRELTHEARYLSASDVVDECLATIMGSSLVVTRLLPTAGVRRRVPVVLQMLENSRFHYEMQLIASKAATDEDVGKERTAFVTESDAMRLLKGVHHKVDLYDPSLELEDPDVVDQQVALAVLGRLRRTALATIPPRQRGAVYNEEVLSGADTLVEVPLSLFAADEDDAVEEDALGYVEVTARSCAGSAVRIDFAVEAAGLGGGKGAGATGGSFHPPVGGSPMRHRSSGSGLASSQRGNSTPSAAGSPFGGFNPSAARAKKRGLPGATPLGLHLSEAAAGTTAAAGIRSPITWSLPEDAAPPIRINVGLSDADNDPNSGSQNRHPNSASASALRSPRTPVRADEHENPSAFGVDPTTVPPTITIGGEENDEAA